MSPPYVISKAPRPNHTLIELTLPPTRLGVTRDDLELYTTQIWEQMFAAWPDSICGEVVWEKTEFAPREELKVQVYAESDQKLVVQEVAQRISDSFRVTNENAHRIAAGILPDERRYLTLPKQFPSSIQMRSGEMKTWVFTADECEGLKDFLDRFESRYVLHLGKSPTLPISDRARPSDRKFIVFTGKDEDSLSGIMFCTELRRGWPVHCVSALATEYPDADFNLASINTGIVHLEWLETIERGQGIGTGMVKALQSLPYDLIELIEGIHVPDQFYERLGFTPSADERREPAAQFSSLRAMTYY